jgi:addiction module RelE/StbE family toxin
MKIIPTKLFIKQYSKLSTNEKEKVDKTLHLFISNPFEKSLRNHTLKGVLAGKRSITVKYNMRIIFEILEKKVFLLAIGTHEKVY